MYTYQKKRTVDQYQPDPTPSPPATTNSFVVLTNVWIVCGVIGLIIVVAGALSFRRFMRRQELQEHDRMLLAGSNNSPVTPSEPSPIRRSRGRRHTHRQSMHAVESPVNANVRVSVTRSMHNLNLSPNRSVRSMHEINTDRNGLRASRIQSMHSLVQVNHSEEDALPLYEEVDYNAKI